MGLAKHCLAIEAGKTNETKLDGTQTKSDGVLLSRLMLLCVLIVFLVLGLAGLGYGPSAPMVSPLGSPPRTNIYIDPRFR